MGGPPASHYEQQLASLAWIVPPQEYLIAEIHKTADSGVSVLAWMTPVTYSGDDTAILVSTSLATANPGYSMKFLPSFLKSSLLVNTKSHVVKLTASYNCVSVSHFAGQNIVTGSTRVKYICDLYTAG